MRRNGIVVLCCHILWGMIATAQAQDQVAPLRGAPASGRVAAVSKSAVTIEVRGESRKFPVNEIRRVIFADDPQELRRARDHCLTGQYDSAIAALKQIDPANVARVEIKQDLQFFTAYASGRQALSQGGDKAAAVNALRAFVSNNRNSFHFYAAAELLGDLAASMESYDNAVRYYHAISAAPWPDYKMKAGILEARALLAQQKPDAALVRFNDVIDQAVDTPEAIRQKLLAEVGMAVCQGELGKHDQAISTLHEIINQNDPREHELFGRAYNALGRCQRKASRPKEALLAYLHVDVLFYEQPDVHAEALYNLSQLWAAVNKSDRATSARSLLTDRYSGSVWAKKN